jgi:hypothetical protein
MATSHAYNRRKADVFVAFLEVEILRRSSSDRLRMTVPGPGAESLLLWREVAP